MASKLRLTTLREALREAMEAPYGNRSVTVEQVHIAQSPALLSVLQFQALDNRRWVVKNIGRVATLASIEGFLQAYANGLLPVLVAEPTARPALDLLDDYARYIKATAGSVGGTFQEYVTGLCNDLISHAETCRRRPLRVTGPEITRRTVEIRRRLDVFRSRQLTIFDADS
ncbi:hypothetical protein E2562_016897 [Oryza meyeriana var. granulata]|uniref:Uncharacterized protein n=1 Tax=Oryza meyeriana var. granulata TaxID=110450 RepID=A0A6G1DX52_9ORYZ|nr:hypothetical protein E2562_016897 [Oryza meyeriana var. granulata]